MKRLLFVCSQNLLRSPTAEKVFDSMGNIQAHSAGLNTGATIPVTEELINWASLIVVMEKHHMNKLRKKFHANLLGKRIVCLNIPDDYAYMDEELIQLLKGKMARYLV